MPRSVPGLAQFLANQGQIAPILLVDIQTLDGTNYFWSDYEGAYPSIITGASQYYYPWIKHGAAFQLARDLTTDAGDVMVQNISGNTIDRDVAAALKNHEFEGALFIARIWQPLLDQALMEFHGYASEQNPTEDECSFRWLQLFDASLYDVCGDIIGELCRWRFKSAQCGSTGSATTCTKLFSQCSDATHSAQEHFSGVLTIIPNVGVTGPPGGVGGGGGGGGDEGGGFDRFGGGGRPGPVRE